MRDVVVCARFSTFCSAGAHLHGRYVRSIFTSYAVARMIVGGSFKE